MKTILTILLCASAYLPSLAAIPATLTQTQLGEQTFYVLGLSETSRFEVVVNHGQLDSFRVLGTVDKLTAEDLERLKQVPELPAFLTDFIHMLPVNEDLRDLERASLDAKSKRTKLTRICSSIGRYKRGYYDANGKDYSQSKRIGRKPNCWGRCGRRCGGKDRYTQECLNHDVCAFARRENMGQCADEFWAAASGTTMRPCK